MFLAHLAPNQGRGDAQGRSMVMEETEEAPKLPPDARLESLDRRLDRAQEAEVAKAAKVQSDPNMRIAQVVIGYLIGGPLGGGLIGWGLDSLFGTKPWLMLVMIFLGFAAGVRSILRISKTPPGRSGTDL
jgi:ATP synthase protein I